MKIQPLQAIRTMLRLQERINCQISSHWRENANPWYRAIWTECAELMDHHGWKWWKRQNQDLAQIWLELVDIWHFGLSDLLQEEPDIDQCADAVLTALNTYRQTSRTSLSLHSPELHQSEHVLQESAAFLQQVEQFSAHCLTTRRFDAPLFFSLLASANMSFETLFEQYVGKNVLNRFRQNHGYKEGSYQKSWDGREDNEHLAELFSVLNFRDDNIDEQLYQQLEKRYQSLTIPA